MAGSQGYTSRVLKVIVLIIVVVLVLLIVLGEIDRNRCGNVTPDVKMYYRGGKMITAPINLFTAASVKKKEDLMAYPEMASNFPRHVVFEDRWEEIRDEVLAVYDKEGMGKIKGDMFFQNIADDNWKKFYIKWYGPVLEDAKQKMPKLASLVESMPEVRCAMISVLEPGSIIKPHVGPFRTSLRYHLGLQTPNDHDNCWIKVDGIKYSWKDGEGVLFDDTYVHEVQNNTKEKRVVLFCDVQRSLKSDFSNAVSNVACKVGQVTGLNRTN